MTDTQDLVIVSKSKIDKAIDDLLIDKFGDDYYISNLTSLRAILDKAQPVISKSAYDGAREDMQIWKKRALEAEKKVRIYDQRIVSLGVLAMESVVPQPAIDQAMQKGE